MATKKKYRSPLYEYVDEMKAELTSQRVWEAVRAGRKLPAIVSRADIDLCIAAGTSVRNQLIVRVFYATGVRVEELSNFMVADIGWDTATMFVRAGKDDKDRLVCVDPGTLEALREYTRHMDVGAPLIGVGPHRISELVVEAGDAVGLVKRYAAMGRRFSPHALRHSFATHLYENGMDLLSLKMLLGHEYLDTTEIYVEVSMKRVQEVYEKTHDYGGKRSGPDVAPASPVVFRLAQEGDETRSGFAAVAERYRTCHELARAAG